ncbi:hypothetical protein EU546_02765, partial [Candidatus Thorarchaeota archaeon]
MSSTWILKTRQMSEAGKEILLREALATHMRSTRDRQLFEELLREPQPLEDVFSFFAAFYLHSYQGIRLLDPEDAPDLTAEGRDELGDEERRQLELEVRQMFADKQRQEVDLARISSELMLKLCDRLAGMNPQDQSTLDVVESLLREHLAHIPEEYSPNHDVDLVIEVTGWGPEWRDELYVKASGLKESAMSLREELLREHPAEVPETTVLHMGLKKVFGRVKYARDHLLKVEPSPLAWRIISEAIVKRFCRPADDNRPLRIAHQMRLILLQVLEDEFDTPTTIVEYEKRLGKAIAGPVADLLVSHSEKTLEILSVFLGIKEEDLRAQFRRRGMSNLSAVGAGLRALKEASTEKQEGPQVSQEELELMERSLKTIEKLEHLLEKPIKGMLRSRGLNPSELDKVSIGILTRKESSLVGIETEVLHELRQRTRVPPPEEVKRLLEIRDQVKSGALSSLGISSAKDFTKQRTDEETILSIQYDIIWHFTISILTNLTRVVESYVRSKQDLLRIKALLKSIYEDTESSLQYLREEILIDLTSMRIYEMKVVHPEFDASTICSWMHARLSSKDMIAAKKDLENTASPVFQGVSNRSLDMSGLEYDNYAIAFDIMHRFLKKERLEKLSKEEYALEAKQKEKLALASKKEQLDVLMYLHNKATTVFRAIGRVGTRGLEWTPNDNAKCANLVAYYIRNKRGREICSACGEVTKKCSQHGTSFIKQSNDMDNLSIFIMRGMFEIKDGLVGAGKGAEPMAWDKAKAMVEREVGILK